MDFFKAVVPSLFSALILGFFAEGIKAQGPSGYDHTRRNYGQSLKHFMESRRLHREIYPPYNQEGRCEDACCDSTREVRYLQGLLFLLEDEGGGGKLHALQRRYDALRGRIVLMAGLDRIRKAYEESLKKLPTGADASVLSSMGEMVLVDGALEAIREDEQLLESLVQAHGEGISMVAKWREHLDCDGENAFCQLLEESKSQFDNILWGLFSAHRAQGGDEDSVGQSFDTYKRALNSALPSNLTDAQAKLALLGRAKENPRGVSIPQAGSASEAFVPENLEEDLGEVKAAIERIRSLMFYQLLASFKQETLAQLKGHCGLEEKSPACFSQEGEEGEEQWRGRPLSKAILSGFIKPYNRAIASKDAPYLEKILSDTGPEFFSLQAAPNCSLPFCSGHNPYFDFSFNTVGRKGICSSSEASSVNRVVASVVETDGDGD